MVVPSKAAKKVRNLSVKSGTMETDVTSKDQSPPKKQVERN